MGGMLATSVVGLVLSRFQDKGAAFQQISFCFAILLLLFILIVFKMPDRTHPPDSLCTDYPEMKIKGLTC